MNYFVEYYKVDNRDEFVAVLQKLVNETKEGTLFTLHIVAHGYEDGLGTAIDTDEVRLQGKKGDGSKVRKRI